MLTMKLKNRLYTLIVLFLFISANNGAFAFVTKTVNLNASRTLESYFSVAEKSTVTHLVVSGSMNPADFFFIRFSLIKLAVLDLRDATPENAQIPDEAFYSTSTPLDTVYLPTKLKKIGYGAFSDCENLSKVFLPDSLIEIGDEAFRQCLKLDSLIIPSKLTTWGESAFAYCSSLKAVTFSEGLHDIGSSAFGNCTSLQRLTFPPSVKYIGQNAFNGCSELSTVVLSEGLDSIGSGAFAFCTKLETVTIPASVQSIGFATFVLSPCVLTLDSENKFMKLVDGVLYNDDMTKLLQCPTYKSGTFVIPETVDTLEMGSFGYCMYLTEVVLPSRLKAIKENAFSLCIGLQTMVLPDSLSSIGPGAFSSTFFSPSVSLGNPYFLVVDSVLFDHSITKLLSCPRSKTGSYSMPESVEMIASSAFEICTELTSVTLPPKLRAIGNNAFKFCESLSTLYITNPIPFVIDKEVFHSTPLEFTIFVPKGSLSDFRNTSGWSSFYSKIREWTLPTSLSNIDNQEVKIRLKNGELIIYGTEAGTSISLISINGTAIRKLTTTDPGETRLSLPSKGLWLVKVGNKTFKVIN